VRVRGEAGERGEWWHVFVDHSARNRAIGLPAPRKKRRKQERNEPTSDSTASFRWVVSGMPSPSSSVSGSSVLDVCVMRTTVSCLLSSARMVSLYCLPSTSLSLNSSFKRSSSILAIVLDSPSAGLSARSWPSLPSSHPLLSIVSRVSHEAASLPSKRLDCRSTACRALSGRSQASCALVRPVRRTRNSKRRATTSPPFECDEEIASSRCVRPIQFIIIIGGFTRACSPRTVHVPSSTCLHSVRSSSQAAGPPRRARRWSS